MKMSATEMVKLNTLKPFARSEYGRISSEYETMSGVNARLCARSSVSMHSHRAALQSNATRQRRRESTHS